MNQKSKQEHLQVLNNNGTDRAISLAKGILGAAPFIGPMIAEVVAVTIPNQRLDRLVKFVEKIEGKLEGVNEELIKIKMQDEYFIDILEDGMWQASRAITDKRKEFIAALLKNSLTNEELSHLEEKRLLDLLSQISDAEVIILQSYGLIGEEYKEFYEVHKEILQAPIVYMGSKQEDIDREAIHKTFRQNLVSLNLLKPRFHKPKKGQLPELDEETGMIKTNGYSLTNLGRLVLSYLDA